MFFITILLQEDIRSFYSQCHVDSLACTNFSQENTPEDCIETHKSSFFLYEQVSRRNGDHE